MYWFGYAISSALVSTIKNITISFNYFLHSLITKTPSLLKYPIDRLHYYKPHNFIKQLLFCQKYIKISDFTPASIKPITEKQIFRT